MEDILTALRAKSSYTSVTHTHTHQEAASRVCRVLQADNIWKHIPQITSGGFREGYGVICHSSSDKTEAAHA